MLREYEELVVKTHKLIDIVLTAAAYLGAYASKKYLLPAPYRGLIDLPNYTTLAFLIIIIWYACFTFFNMYASYRYQTFSKIFWTMVKAVFTGMLFLGLCMYLLKITDVSRIMMGIFFLLNITLLGLSKGITYGLLTKFRRHGYNFRNLLIIGARERAIEIIDAVGNRSESGFRVLGCLTADPMEVGKVVRNNIRVIDTIDSLEKILRDQVVDQVLFSLPLKRIDNVERYLLLAEEMGVPARIFPDWQVQKIGYEPKIATFRFEAFWGIPALTLTTTPDKHRELFMKSIFDRGFAGFALVLCLPLFLLISIAIKLGSKGPVFFRQERIGYNGRVFRLYKFRTMVFDAEAKQEELKGLNESGGPVFKIKKDPRITPFTGFLLRRTGLDELPQLINVLTGEMSLVGPRPPMPDEVKKYDAWHRRRLSMKPGLTCLWQITRDRNDIDFEKWMNLDLKYIDNWSLGLDFRILLKTAWMMLEATGR